ncbi:lymphocyte antigen 6A-2/6E-1-like [Grammomys surdaster]|uniref:lymphocyte antigen 6A-2/6E-1-like n=1 Tax=Grammomys surdaster TaxID=491861 RepID=UPI00109F9CBA|nr:lymphocyte antigen 6A-2/6E-1-like [Grammomys surdaster]
MNSYHTTKSCVLILFVALLCAPRGQGLKCYNCQRVPLEAPCSSVTCFKSNPFCVTQVTELAVGSHIRKLKNSMCYPICPTNLQNVEILSTIANVTSFCCKKDLCNVAIPTGGSTRSPAVVLLFSLGSVLLQTLL